MAGQESHTSRTISLLIAICLLSLPAYAKYSGGTGEPNDPYQIATAADLIALGETPEDYDKHFILIADIDLDPNLPGRKVFEMAVIAPDTDPTHNWYGYNEYDGILFSGVFDGNDHTVSHLMIDGGDHLGLFGRIDFEAEIKNLGVVDACVVDSGSNIAVLVGDNDGSIATSYSSGAVNGSEYVGGLVGTNSGSISQCYSSVTVKGDWDVGGLVGSNTEWGNVTLSYIASTVSGNLFVGGLIGNNNYGGVTYSYSTGVVRGDGYVGGLLGGNVGVVTSCYSTGAVSGSEHAGGLVGVTDSPVIACFWDTQTSGQAESDGGIGKTTAEMQDLLTYVAVGWDFLGEKENGLHEIWQLPEGGGYPVLAILSGYAPPQLEGRGTLEDPYLISSASELGSLFYYSLSAHYRLAASIDLTGINWRTAVIPRRFAGTFDGSSHTILHLAIEGRGSLGLFGVVNYQGEVTNLSIVDVNLVGDNGSVGGLAGYSEGTLTGCYSTGAVTGSGSAGGLVGHNMGRLTQCRSTATVTGGRRVGGLVGDNWGNVTESGSTGTVNGSDSVGGLTGFNYGNVNRSNSAGTVSGNTRVGGRKQSQPERVLQRGHG